MKAQRNFMTEITGHAPRATELARNLSSVVESSLDSLTTRPETAQKRRSSLSLLFMPHHPGPLLFVPKTSPSPTKTPWES